MKDQQIALLKQQIAKLEDKNFDLKAWKAHTMIILASIFGEDSQKVKEIGRLDYEFSSWSLRDATGHNTYQEGCKRLGKEIIEASINEIELTGLPQKRSATRGMLNIQVILDALNDELKGSQYKNLLKIIKSNDLPEEKERLIKEIINEVGPEATRAILTNMLLSDHFAEALSLKEK